MKELITETLEIKKKEYEAVNNWFSVEYNSSVSEETLFEFQIKANELNAQIEILNFLLSKTND